MKEITKTIILALIFGAIYVGLEILFRGYSHWSMFIVAAAASVVIGGLNNYLPWEMPILG